ncbi:MAG TPA: hypothetical protein VFF36_15165, partial [Planctomycetota bacterium]|nr:hypothetical protein [Planctomycetota bacterium]
MHDLAVAAVARLRTETEASVYSEDSQILAFIREYRREVQAALQAHGITDPRALSEALGELRREYARATNGQLATALRNCMAGNDEDTALRLIEASGGDTPAVRTAPSADGAAPADPAAVVTDLRGRMGDFHVLIERMIAAEGGDKLAAFGPIDDMHAELVHRAEGRGLRGPAARTAVEDAYRLEIGHGLVDQLRMAVRGDEVARRAVEERMGYTGRLGAAPYTDAAGAAELRNAYQRIARTMYGQVNELRSADWMDFVAVSRIDETFDRLDTEGRTRGLASRSEQLALFDQVYRELNGVPFVGHLRQACEGNASQIAELERRLGISLSAGASAGGARGDGSLDLALQGLHDVFAESWVDDQQVVDACTRARDAARALGLSLDAMRSRYEERFRTGLAGQIRSRVSDEALRRSALQACGIVEDRTSELVGELTRGAGARTDAVTHLVEVAGTVAAAIHEGRWSVTTVNRQAQIFRAARLGGSPDTDASAATSLTAPPVMEPGPALELL